MHAVGRALLPVILVGLIAVGIFVPAMALATPSSSPPTESQLQAIVGAAESSRAYAYSAVDEAVANHLSVGSAQSKLSAGDSALATAQADAQSASDITGGVQAAKAAMLDYADASSTATVALQGAGIIYSVDVDAQAGAIAQVNAAISAMAAVEAQACANISASSNTTSAVAQACSQVSLHLANARTSINEAAGVVAQVKAGAEGSANLSAAVAFVVQARAEVQAAASALTQIGSLTVEERARAYVAVEISQLSAAANGTISTQESVYAGFSGFVSNLQGSATAQGQAVDSLNASVKALSNSISAVDVSAVSTSVSAARITEDHVGSNLSAIVSLVSLLPGSANLVSSVSAAQSSISNYDAATNTVVSQGASFAGTQLSDFHSYATALSGSTATANSAGSAYVSSVAGVKSSLSTFLSTAVLTPLLKSELLALQTNLNSLSTSVASTTESVDSAMAAEVSAVSTVDSSASMMTSTFETNQGQIAVPTSLTSNLGALTTQARSYLNATAVLALSASGTALQSDAQSAQNYVSSVQASLGGTVGGFVSSEASLYSSSASVKEQAQATIASATTAQAYISSDLSARAAAAAQGRVLVANAVQFFSAGNDDAGISALGEASLEFQVASSTGASSP